MKPDDITLAEAAYVLGLTEEGVTSLMGKGWLRGKRIGSQWFFTRNEVLACRRKLLNEKKARQGKRGTS